MKAKTPCQYWHAFACHCFSGVNVNCICLKILTWALSKSRQGFHYFSQIFLLYVIIPHTAQRQDSVKSRFTDIVSIRRSSLGSLGYLGQAASGNHRQVIIMIDATLWPPSYSGNISGHKSTYIKVWWCTFVWITMVLMGTFWKKCFNAKLRFVAGLPRSKYFINC